MTAATDRGWDVRVIATPAAAEGEWAPHPPGTGGERLAAYPWARALDALEAQP
ncbi:hypothetical protein [Streptomyces sp. UNOC14_S4]|uniref:hypothetical protein n=1 Tax=Streptomyces sp. UNOC14_S4 TaxID=2872340 RepID=UPI001E402D47|nr:hypothetical protein [Streptomyces sp. UNOC14_S4]MCC3767115.1 hypothetical protein [Streptomyces sp. UNOC14_S4]